MDFCITYRCMRVGYLDKVGIRMNTFTKKKKKMNTINGRLYSKGIKLRTRSIGKSWWA